MRGKGGRGALTPLGRRRGIVLRGEREEGGTRADPQSSRAGSFCFPFPLPPPPRRVSDGEGTEEGRETDSDRQTTERPSSRQFESPK
jgi:hypothetical protein